MTIQPIPLVPPATSNASGAVTFSVPMVPTSQTWVGSLFVIGAPTSAQFTATAGADCLGQWIGANTYGPITVDAAQALTVTGTGLAANTQYQLSWQGTVFTEQSPPADYGPLPIASFVQNQQLTSQYLSISDYVFSSSGSIALSSLALPPGWSITSYKSLQVNLQFQSLGSLLGTDTVTIQLVRTTTISKAVWSQTVPALLMGQAGGYTFAVPLTIGTAPISQYALVYRSTSTALCNADVYLDTSTTSPAVMLAGAETGLQVPVQPLGRELQFPAYGNRGGGLGIGTTFFGPAGASAFFVTGVTIGWTFSTLTLTGTLDIVVEDAGTNILGAVPLSNGQTGYGQAVFRFADDGVAASGQFLLNFQNATAMTATGKVWASVSYRE